MYVRVFVVLLLKNQRLVSSGNGTVRTVVHSTGPARLVTAQSINNPQIGVIITNIMLCDLLQQLLSQHRFTATLTLTITTDVTAAHVRTCHCSALLLQQQTAMSDAV
jgi:hypothetical protein